MRASRLAADGHFNHMFKVIIIGESGVGKSHLFEIFCDQAAAPSKKPTAGVRDIKPSVSIELRTRLVQLDDVTVKLHIWDTVGQEKFASLTQNYYRATQGVLVVFDVTSSSSFASLHKWLTEVSQLCDRRVACILIGHKADANELRTVSTEEARNFANQCGMLYAETTVNDPLTIESAFEALSRKMLNYVDPKKPTPNDASFRLPRSMTEGLSKGPLNRHSNAAEVKVKSRNKGCC